MAKGFVKISENYCKSCGLCVSVCPKKILEINTDKVNVKGYYPISVTNMDECIGCASCAKICPEIVFEVGRMNKGGM